jgi:hypothetical protein
MATAPAERPPFVLSDYNIVSLSRNSGLVQQFPWLVMRSALVKRSCCGRPAQVDQRVIKSETDRIRNFVATMPQVELVKFKQALGQSRIRILYPDGTTKDRV